MNLRQGNKSRSNQLWLWRLSSLDVSNFFGYLLPSLQHTPCIQDNFSSNLHNFNGNWATTRLQNFLLFVVAVVAEFAATPLPYKSAEEEPKNVYWLLIVTIGDEYQGMRVFLQLYGNKWGMQRHHTLCIHMWLLLHCYPSCLISE
jgi:hypothetical protein